MVCTGLLMMPLQSSADTSNTSYKICSSDSDTVLECYRKGVIGLANADNFQMLACQDYLTDYD